MPYVKPRPLPREQHTTTTENVAQDYNPAQEVQEITPPTAMADIEEEPSPAAAGPSSNTPFPVTTRRTPLTYTRSSSRHSYSPRRYLLKRPQCGPIKVTSPPVLGLCSIYVMSLYLRQTSYSYLCRTYIILNLCR